MGFSMHLDVDKRRFGGIKGMTIRPYGGGGPSIRIPKPLAVPNQPSLRERIRGECRSIRFGYPPEVMEWGAS